MTSPFDSPVVFTFSFIKLSISIDDVLPINDSKEAIKLLPKGSRLEVIDNWEHGDHKMDESMDIIIPKTVDWFEKHL